MKDPFENSLELHGQKAQTKSTEALSGVSEVLKTITDSELSTAIQNLSHEDANIIDYALNLEGELWQGFATIETDDVSEVAHKLAEFSLTTDALLKKTLAKEIARMLG